MSVEQGELRQIRERLEASRRELLGKDHPLLRPERGQSVKHRDVDQAEIDAHFDTHHGVFGSSAASTPQEVE